jgi:alkylation response protein AidB-like acyl-CoA dehydrogenase
MNTQTVSQALPEQQDDPESSVLAMVLKQARRFAAQELDPVAFDRAERLPREVLTAAAQAGLFGLSIEEKYGGLGLSLGDTCKVVSELSDRDCSFATSVGLHNGLGTRGLVAYGCSSLQAKLLPKLASGEMIASFAATETGAGSDLMAISTTATPVEGGVRVDGEKNYVTNGGFAKLFTVLTRSPQMGGARAHSLICVPRDTPGVHIGAEEHKMGLRSSSTVTVHFDGAVVPMEYVLGTPGQGMAYAHHALTWGRTIMSAGCVGAARGGLKATLGYVLSRKQFGRAIGEFGASRAHAAIMASKLWAMEAMVEYTGAQEARGEPIEALSAATKVFCSNGVFDICDRAIQLHGALGFLNDLGIERLLRDARVTRIFEGANDVLLVHLGAGLIALPATNKLRRVHYETCPRLSETAKMWEAINASLEEALISVHRRYGIKVVKQQLVLQRLASSHIAVQAASASIWRAQHASDDAKSLADNAARMLLDEATDILKRLDRAEQDAARDLALSDALYTAGRLPEPACLSPLILSTDGESD